MSIRRHRRRHRHHRHESEPTVQRRRDRLTPEEKLYREARSRANRRLGWTIHAICYGSVLAIILVSSRSFRATLIVALAWGIGLSVHYFTALVAPRLRERWIEEEVGRHVDRGVSGLHAAEHANARSLEDLSASIAHEIRNPVTAAKSLVQQMGEDPVSEENIDFARVALEELDRVERSISHLLKYAREEDFAFEDVHIPELIDSSLRALDDRIGSARIDVTRDFDAAGMIRGDSEKLRRVFLNLFSNAVDSLQSVAPEDRRILVQAGENLAGSAVWVRIRDTGPGIEGTAAERIFDPFYTTKETGTGLGLALAKKIVDAHGGSMEAIHDEPGGAEFLLTFPKNVHSEEARA